MPAVSLMCLYLDRPIVRVLAVTIKVLDDKTPTIKRVRRTASRTSSRVRVAPEDKEATIASAVVPFLKVDPEEELRKNMPRLPSFWHEAVSTDSHGYVYSSSFIIILYTSL